MNAETLQRVGVQPVRASGGYRGVVARKLHGVTRGLHASCTGSCTLGILMSDTMSSSEELEVGSLLRTWFPISGP